VYKAVGYAIEHVATKGGVDVVQVPVAVPLDIEKVLADFKTALGTNTKLCIIDHINSPYAFVLPIERFISIAHEHNALVLIDGAHSLGQIPIDMGKIDADFYTSNCHKWFFSGSGSAFLWINPKHQDHIFPNVISHGFKDGLTARFCWTGTADYTPFLSINASIDMFNRLGFDKIMTHNNTLALEAAKYLRSLWGTRFSVDEKLGYNASMYTIQLPEPKSELKDKPVGERAVLLGDLLIERYKIEVPIIAGASVWWLRISAQIYNCMEDYVALGEAVNKLLGRFGEDLILSS
jgi:isopenicillin-N epimerase